MAEDIIPSSGDMPAERLPKRPDPKAKISPVKRSQQFMSSAAVRGNSPPSVSAYKYLLSGGAAQFSLSQWNWGVVVGIGWFFCQGFGLLGQVGVFSGGSRPSIEGAALLRESLIGGIGVGLGAAATAMLAARWLGRKVGLWAGLIDALLTGLVLMGLAGGVSGILPGAVYGLLARWTIGSFALANISGPRPLVGGKWIKWLFWLGMAGCWLSGGGVGLLVPVGICLVSLAWLEDARGLRFFLFPVGWLAAGSLVVGGEIFRLFGPREWTGWMSLAGGNAEIGIFGRLPATSFLSSGVGSLWVLGGGMVLLGIAAAAGVWKWMTLGGMGSPGGSLFGAWAITAGVGLVLEILRSKGFLLGRIASGENSLALAMLTGMLAPPWAVAASIGWRRFWLLMHRNLLR